MAKRCAGPMNLVSCDLLALPGAAYDNADVG
jgi:hypothetical protein